MSSRAFISDKLSGCFGLSENFLFCTGLYQDIAVFLQSIGIDIREKYIDDETRAGEAVPLLSDTRPLNDLGSRALNSILGDLHSPCVTSSSLDVRVGDMQRKLTDWMR
jgi:hypothetical protein